MSDPPSGCYLHVLLISPHLSEAKGLSSNGFLLSAGLDLPMTEDFILTPLLLGFVLALLASLMLWCSSALLRR